MSSVSTAINTRFDIYDNGWAAGCGGACPAAQNTGKDLVRTNAAPGGNNCALQNQGWRQVAAAGRYLPAPVTRTDNNVKIGRTSCRERGCRDVVLSGGAVAL